MALLTQYARKPLILPHKGILMDNAVMCFAPLRHPHCSKTPFLSKDKYGLSIAVTGALWTAAKGWTTDGIDDKLVIPLTTDLGSTYTIEMWIKDPLTDTGDLCGGVTSGFNALLYTLTNGTIGGCGQGNWSGYAGSAAGVIIANKWHFVRGVWSGKTLTIFVDGVQVATRTDPTWDCAWDTTGLRVGAGGNYGYKNCSFGMVRISNNAEATAIGKSDYQRSRNSYMV